jgi:transcriptional antiterminator RfaH
MCWYLIHTKAAAERVASANLEYQGYRVYHPRLIRRTRVRGRWLDRIASLFPRYLFLQLDAGRQALAPVRSTVGVANVVRFGSEFASVPDSVVEGLRQRADPQSGLHRLADQGHFERNSPVRLIGGLFDGLEGVFVRESGAERVWVLLNILGHSTAVRIPAALVVPQSRLRASSVWPR